MENALMASVRNRFDELISKVKRPGMDKLMETLEDSGFFYAPASSGYHLAKDGGLLEHSVNVANLALKLEDRLEHGASRESIILVALFHDLGKAGDYGKSNYVENILKSGKRSEAKPFETNKELLAIPHEVASVAILNRHILLSEEEAFAILYHNGLYTNIGYGLRGNEKPLQMLLHFADLWASRVVEK